MQDGAQPPNRRSVSGTPDLPFSDNVLRLLACACAVCVGNVYYLQPLLIAVGQGVGLDHAVSGLIPTLAQAGVALGVLFVVPLADMMDNRRLTTAVITVQIVAVVTLANARSSTQLLSATLAMGLAGVTPYILPALAVPGRVARQLACSPGESFLAFWVHERTADYWDTKPAGALCTT